MKVNIPTPPQKLFRQFEAGEISRTELQKTCALHQREMIAEIEEMRLNPLAAYVENLLLKREVAKVRRLYGEGLVREVLHALAEVPDFPPAILFWNAEYRDVPLHCFFRFRREPIFRIVEIVHEGMQLRATVDYGSSSRKKTTRETFSFHRGAGDQLIVSRRKLLSK